MPNRPLRIGTRGSALAHWQTERIRSLLEAAGSSAEPVEIKTTGDLTPDVPLSRIGSRALFTKQIDDALLAGRIDLAVHSLKDLPTRLPDGIVIGAVGEREDPRDALVGRSSISWEGLPRGAILATSSLRRRAQMLYHRPDLRIVDIRGNVDTRLAKLTANADWSGIVLATAGLVRLGAENRIGERLAPDLLLPAPGQGALAITVRADDERVLALVRSVLHNPGTALTISAERAFLARLEGGCQVPIAAYAERQGERGDMLLHGRVVAPDGRTLIEGRHRRAVTGEADARELGSMLADELLAQGAGDILAQARAGVPAISEP
ncbi:MAG: hydroxymethylbilane synthase [Gemmatimonadales bacterium]